jgi:hypothetical protein
MADQLQSSTMPGLSGIGGVINGQDPNYLYSVMQAQRQKMLADALTQQSMGGIDYDKNGAISPLQGLAKMLQAYTGMKGAAAANHTLADAQAVGNQRTMQSLQGLFGGNVTDPTAASTASLTQGAMTQPSTPDANGQMVNQGGVGPTLTNAQRMGQMLSGGTGQQGAAFSVPGMTSQQMTMAYLMDPQGTMKAAFDAKALTEQQKNSRDPLIGAPTVNNLLTQNMTPEQKLSMNLQQLQQQGVPDTDPQVQALKGALAKANYIDPLAVKQGNLVLDPITHQPIAYNPSVSDGITPTFQTAGGVTSPTGASALPGYAGSNANIAGAEQGAKQRNTIFSVPGPGGSQLTNWGGVLAGGGAGGYPAAIPAPAPNAQPAAVGAPGVSPPMGSQAPVQASVAPRPSGTVGQSTTDAQINEAAGKTMAQLPQMVTQAKQVRLGLQNALGALDNTTTGPGTEKAFSLAATLQNMGLPVAKTPTENYQTLSKYLNNSLAISAGVNGNTGSDSRFDQFMHGQPSADLMNKGPLRGAINYVLSQIDAVPAGAQVMQQEYAKAKAAGDPNAAYTAQQAWSNQYDPRVFQFNRMGPDEKAAFKAHLLQTDPAGAATFGQKYNQFHQNNWVQ